MTGIETYDVIESLDQNEARFLSRCGCQPPPFRFRVRFSTAAMRASRIGGWNGLVHIVIPPLSIPVSSSIESVRLVRKMMGTSDYRPHLRTDIKPGLSGRFKVRRTMSDPPSIYRLPTRGRRQAPLPDKAHFQRIASIPGGWQRHPPQSKICIDFTSFSILHRGLNNFTHSKMHFDT